MSTTPTPPSDTPSAPNTASPISAPSAPAAPRVIADAQWLALTCLTESSLAHEWPIIAAVILNRVESPAYPYDLYRVVRQRYQFSAFNAFQSITDESALYDAVKGSIGLHMANLPSDSLACATAMLALPRGCSILPPTTYNYWSPRSMSPAGSLPRAWDWPTLHCFAYPGIDPRRFVFATTCADTTATPTANQAQFAY